MVGPCVLRGDRMGALGGVGKVPGRAPCGARPHPSPPPQAGEGAKRKRERAYRAGGGEGSQPGGGLKRFTCDR
jgi:hypothetical protein